MKVSGYNVYTCKHVSTILVLSIRGSINSRNVFLDAIISIFRTSLCLSTSSSSKLDLSMTTVAAVACLVSPNATQGNTIEYKLILAALIDSEQMLLSIETQLCTCRKKTFCKLY